MFSLVFCFQKSNVQTLGSNSCGQRSLLDSHKRTRTRNSPPVVPFKTGRNLQRGDLSETDKDEEHLPSLSARPRLPAAEMPGVASQKQTRNTPSYQPKENGLRASRFLVPFSSRSFLFFLFACLLRQGSGSYVHFCPIDEPGFPPTDIRDHTKCAVRALMPTLASSPPHVCMGFTKRLDI